MSWQQIIAGMLLVGTGISFLWVFLMILVYDKYYVFESNQWILAIELAMSALIAMYGVVRVYDAYKKGKGQ